MEKSELDLRFDQKLGLEQLLLKMSRSQKRVSQRLEQWEACLTRRPMVMLGFRERALPQKQGRECLERQK